MAELQILKRRIRSVTGTRQITKAMQLVAASKLRRALAAAEEPVSYREALRQLVDRLGNGAGVARHALYEQRPVKTALVVIITADRGLAGPYNYNIFRALSRQIDEINVPVQAITVGLRGALHIARAEGVDEIAAYAMDDSEADAGLAQPVLAEIMEAFTTRRVDVVYLISTRFHTSVRQEVQMEQLLPIVALPETVTSPETEPSLNIVLGTAVERLLEAELYQALVDAKASEQAARMLAMMNASDNADDLIADLTLARNNARQAAITQELAEISAGAEAVIT